jgi:hypothetical protein
MRFTSDPRPTGYPVAIVLFLVAPWCALVGSQWIAAAMGGAGTAMIALLSRVGRGGQRRRAGSTVTPA